MKCYIWSYQIWVRKKNTFEANVIFIEIVSINTTAFEIYLLIRILITEYQTEELLRF